MKMSVINRLQVLGSFRLWNNFMKPAVPCCCQLQQVRFKKGKGRFKAPPSEKEKSKWVPKVNMSAPVKSLADAQLGLGTPPEDDVWILKNFARQKYTFKEAIDMHKELAHPEMYDNSSAFVSLDAELDMTTRKKTKFMTNITGTILLPHLFDDGLQKRVLAFCKSQEEKERAEECGATFAGGIDLVKALQKGDIHSEEYDHVVCTMEMIPDVTPIRKLLQLNFPSQAKGSLGVDLEKMIQHFSLGKTYQSEKLQTEVSKIRLNLGMLNMGYEALQDNLDAYVEAISKHRSPSLGPFIIYGEIVLDPPQECFVLLPSELSKEQANIKTNQTEKDNDQDVDDDEERIIVSL